MYNIYKSVECQQPVAVSPHVSGYYTLERFIAEMCSRDVILELRSVRWELSAQVRSAVERAGCGRTCRGCRTGKHVKARRHCIAYSETSDGEIPVLSTTCRRRSNSSAGRVGDRTALRALPLGRHVELQTAASALRSSATLSRGVDDPAPSLYVLNAPAITKPHATEHLTADVTGHNVDVAVITETHLKKKHADHHVAIDGYALFRRDRVGRPGGGVAVYVSSRLSADV